MWITNKWDVELEPPEESGYYEGENDYVEYTSEYTERTNGSFDIGINGKYSKGKSKCISRVRICFFV